MFSARNVAFKEIPKRELRANETDACAKVVVALHSKKSHEGN
jgi:hypothetical protein